MRILTFENNGQSITFTNVFPNVLSKISGLDRPTTNIISEKGYRQNGTNFIESLYEARIINAVIGVQRETKALLDEALNELSEVFDSSLGLGTLTYNNGITERQISAVVDYYEELAEPKNLLTRFYAASFYCPNPNFESVDEYTLKLVGFIGGLTFPMTFPFRLGTQGDRVEIDYNGVLAAPILIKLEGEATVPKIIKEETGEYIQIDTDIEPGDVLFIDTTPKATDIYIVRDGEEINATNYLSPLSTYFQMTKGINTISFEAASGSPEIYIYWREQFLKG